MMSQSIADSVKCGLILGNGVSIGKARSTEKKKEVAIGKTKDGRGENHVDRIHC